MFLDSHDELKIHTAPYRVKEVVWYKLPQSHVYPGNERQVITHWPGKVNARTLKIETHHLEIVEMEDLNGDKVQIPQPVNAQYYVYSIELLGVGESTVIECRVEELLPWVAYACPDALRGPQATALLKKTDATLSNLNPSEQVFEEVLTAWAWARHVATAVQTYYCPAGFFLDRETSKKLRRRRKGYASGTKKGKKTRAGKEAREKEYDRELEMLASNVQQYQMVWFGCEKIWVGDMVRLAGTFELPSSVRDAKHGNQHNDKTKKSNGNSKVFSAYIQLYKGRTRQDGKGQFVKLDGYTMTEEHIGNPAFLQVTHIYRLPPDAEQGGAGSPGTLLFDGHIYELAKDDEDPWHASKKPPSLYGDMQGILDASDTSSSSTAATATSKQDQDQGGIVDSSNGTRRKKTAQESISNMYKKSLLPPSPPGYSFKPLKRVEGASEDECASGIPVFMIAG